MSEAELHWLRLRLNGAQRRKAQRGDLHFAAPTGYVWGDGGFEIDPDLAVRRAIGMIFERFATEPTANAVIRWAHREGFRVPTRRSFAPSSRKAHSSSTAQSQSGRIWFSRADPDRKGSPDDHDCSARLPGYHRGCASCALARG